jgi:L-fuculose-phosphate aldolase
LLTDSEIKGKIIEIGKRIYSLGFIAAADGNLSYRHRERIFITVSGVGKGNLTAEDIIIVNGEGKPLSGRKKPTSELPMHLAVYKLRNDVTFLGQRCGSDFRIDTEI